jgi:hypothetical protein
VSAAARVLLWQFLAVTLAVLGTAALLLVVVVHVSPLFAGGTALVGTGGAVVGGAVHSRKRSDRSERV